MAKSQAPLKIVGGRNPSLNYAPPERINHAVPGVEWPFVEMPKKPGDVVISLAVTPTRKGQDRATGLGSWVAGISSKWRRAMTRPSPDGRRMAETENTGSGRKPDQQVPGSKTCHGRNQVGGITMTYPSIWQLQGLVGYVERGECAREIEPGKWVPARPRGFCSIGQRIKAAKLVFTGKADAVLWPGQ